MGGGRLRTGSFTGARGRTIFWRAWDSDGDAEPGPALAIVVIVHGFAEHGARYEHVAARLRREGYAVYVPDHHGHGQSQGIRGRISFDDAVADLDQVVDLAQQHEPNRRVFMLGHSMGGSLAMRYALAHQDRLSGLIASAPLVQVEGRAAAKLLGRLLGTVAPGLPLARLDPNALSRDPEVVRAYVDDPLVFHRPLPAATAAEFLRRAATLPDAVAAVRVPTLLMYGTGDRVCAPQGSVLVAERIGSSELTTIPYDGLYHEILNEPERDRVLDDVCGWLAARAPGVAAER